MPDNDMNVVPVEERALITCKQNSDNDEQI